MKKLLLVIAVLVIAGGVYYATTMKPNDSMMMDEEKMADPRISAAWQMMIGPWVSEEDSGFARVYKNDGTVVDAHGSAAGSTETTGTWSLFVADNAPDVEFQLNNNDVYVEQTEPTGEKTHYRVVNITPDTLELVNMTKGGGTRFSRLAVGGEMAEGAMSATFMCDDSAHGFMATFPSTMAEVIISSEGEENVIPAVESTSGKVFENEMWSFVFKGEGVTVTDKGTKTSEKCTQPFDAENAPMNFGD